MADIRIATRRSPLAMVQARLVGERLTTIGAEVTLVPVTTSGDRDRVSPVAALSEVGAFVRSVQVAVLDDRADIAVHSAKDLPVADLDGLAAVYPEREEPWDVLCGSTMDDLQEGAVVGTGSPRRGAQLRLLRPDLELREIRGNVETRLQRVEDGEYDATVLAAAGLNRLELEPPARQRLGLDEMVPAAGQGTLAVEARTGTDAWELLQQIDDPDTRAAIEAERAVLEISQAGCRAALGAYARVGDAGIELHGFVADDRGMRRSVVTGDVPRSVASVLCDELGIRP